MELLERPSGIPISARKDSLIRESVGHGTKQTAGPGQAEQASDLLSRWLLHESGDHSLNDRGRRLALSERGAKAENTFSRPANDVPNRRLADLRPVYR